MINIKRTFDRYPEEPHIPDIYIPNALDNSNVASNGLLFDFNPSYEMLHCVQPVIMPMHNTKARREFQLANYAIKKPKADKFGALYSMGYSKIPIGTFDRPSGPFGTRIPHQLITQQIHPVPLVHVMTSSEIFSFNSSNISPPRVFCSKKHDNSGVTGPARRIEAGSSFGGFITMCPTSSGPGSASLIISSTKNQLLNLDIESSKRNATSKNSHSGCDIMCNPTGPVTHMVRSSHSNLITGTSSGIISILDMNSFGNSTSSGSHITPSIDAGASTPGTVLLDIDILGNTICTCIASGAASADSNFVKLFDIRMMREIDSIAIPALSETGSEFYGVSEERIPVCSRIIRLNSSTLKKYSSVSTFDQSWNLLITLCADGSLLVYDFSSGSFIIDERVMLPSAAFDSKILATYVHQQRQLGIYGDLMLPKMKLSRSNRVISVGDGQGGLSLFELCLEEPDEEPMESLSRKLEPHTISGDKESFYKESSSIMGIKEDIQCFINNYSKPVPSVSPMLKFPPTDPHKFLSSGVSSSFVDVDDYSVSLNSVGMPQMNDGFRYVRKSNQDMAERFSTDQHNSGTPSGGKLLSANFPGKWVHDISCPVKPQNSVPSEILGALKWRTDPVRCSYPVNNVDLGRSQNYLFSKTGDEIGGIGDKNLEKNETIKVGFAPNVLRDKMKRNEQNLSVIGNSSASLFLSSKERQNEAKAHHSKSDAHSSSKASTKISLNKIGNETDAIRRISPAVIPEFYSQPQIKYSKFGIEDFDFEFFNKNTGLSGLENHLDQCFLNAVIESLIYGLALSCSYIPGTSNKLNSNTASVSNGRKVSHGCNFVLLELFRLHAFPYASQSSNILDHRGASVSWKRCDQEQCLVCELAFLGDMLEQARGSTCQASNFFKAFKSSDQAMALGLLDKSNYGLSESGSRDPVSGQIKYFQMAQNCFRFFLNQMHQKIFAATDGSKDNPKKPLIVYNSAESDKDKEKQTLETEKSLMHQLMGLEIQAQTVCSECKTAKIRDMISFSIDLDTSAIPDIVTTSGNAKPIPPETSIFCEMLNAVLLKQSQTKAWCDNCKQYKILQQTRSLNVNNAPPLLTVMCGTTMMANSRDLMLGTRDSKFQFVAEDESGSIEDADDRTFESLIAKINQHESFALKSKQNKSAKKIIGNDAESEIGDKRNFQRKRLLEKRWKVWTDSAQMDYQIFGKTFIPPSLIIKSNIGSKYIQKDASESTLNIIEEWSPEGVNQENVDCSDESVIYDLSMMICQVDNEISRTPNNSSHLISFIRIPVDYVTSHSKTRDSEDASSTKKSDDSISNFDFVYSGPKYQWYMFNDFRVRPVSAFEVVQLKSKWKVPAIIQYTRRDASKIVNLSHLEEPIKRQSRRAIFDAVMLGGDVGVAPHVVPLEFAEFREVMMKYGRFNIGIDAEFVSLAAEQIEVKSDGSKSIVRPQVMQLARISLLRAQEPNYLVPLIDDYIMPLEPVVDYLTEYSGITAEDLDPTTSRHRLVGLKSVYRQLKLLVDLGATFIGHGLKKDFRTINIVVPPNQVIDTVELYKLDGQRNISLKYLAWYMLGLDVQTVLSGHDSIEDAKTAVLLFNKLRSIIPRSNEAENANLEYQETRLKEFLENLYADGRKYGWKKPV